MNTKIEYFKFEIKPWLYANERRGTSQILHLQINVNGEEYHNEKVIDFLDQIPSYMSTVQFYTHLAMLALEEKLKEIGEPNGN